MADENIVRSYRSIGPARRPSEPMPARDVDARGVGARDEAARSDPLAELARLIGQSDPFADPPPASSRGRAPSPPPPRPDPAPASDWRATAAALAREALRNPPMDDPSHDRPYHDRPYDEPYDEADPQVERINSAIAAIDSYRSGSDHYAEPEHSAFESEHDRDSHYDEAPHHPVSDAGPYAEEAAEVHEAHEEPNYFFDGELSPPDPEQRFYDDPPRARRANGLVTAAVLVGCALLGTAGAYGYRSYYSGARTTDAPIISADPTPSKVVPATAGIDSGKPGQDRVADKAPDERIVTHAEEPVTLGAPSPAPRVVLPAPFAPAPGAKPPAPPASTSASASNVPPPATGGQEPKKVRTVAIKPDGTDAAVRPLTTASTPPPAQATLAAPPAPARPAPSAKPAPQPRSNGGPLSLEPRAGDPAAAAPAPAERAPKLASVSSGGYVVQISSQTSEAEAHTSFRTLQTKYPHELGDRDALIERGDTPNGVRYRALVGPFASMTDAQQFCTKYKAAGGDCFARRN
jgi:hypothetical protein